MYNLIKDVHTSKLIAWISMPNRTRYNIITNDRKKNNNNAVSGFR